MALPGLVAYGSGEDSDADETGVERLGSGPVLVGAAQLEPDVAALDTADGSREIAVPGSDAAPGSRSGLRPGPAGSVPEISAAEQNLPTAEAGGAAPMDTEAASQKAPEAEDDAEGLAGLPPELQRPPDTAQDPELEEKVKFFMKIRMEQGRLISNNLKAERGYRNPSFLQKMVEHHEIDQYGSAFVKQWGRKEDVFDPHALHEEDFTDALARADRAEEEARKQRAKQTGRLEFQPAATSKGAAVAQLPPAAATGASLSRPPSAPLSMPARTSTSLAAAAIVANAKGAADVKQRERNRWDSKASRR